MRISEHCRSLRARQSHRADVITSVVGFVGMVIFVRVVSTVSVLSADEDKVANAKGDSRPKNGDRRNGRMVEVRTCSI